MVRIRRRVEYSSFHRGLVKSGPVGVLPFLVISGAPAFFLSYTVGVFRNTVHQKALLRMERSLIFVRNPHTPGIHHSTVSTGTVPVTKYGKVVCPENLPYFPEKRKIKKGESDSPFFILWMAKHQLVLEFVNNDGTAFLHFSCQDHL